MTEGTILMNAEEIDRALARIAHQVLEFNGGSRDLALVGIHRRGVPLARRLAWKIAQAGEEAPPVGILDINMYRDDLSTTRVQPVVRRTELPFKVAERQVVLVDDVLYTGRTIRAALDALIDLGRPKAIRLAVLVDRGGRELPIQSDFCGRAVAVAAGDSVEVRLAEIDGGPDAVAVVALEELRRRLEAPKRALAALAASGGAPPAPAGKSKTRPKAATKAKSKATAKSKAKAKTGAAKAAPRPGKGRSGRKG